MGFRFVGAVAADLFLASCQATHPNAGSGTVELTRRVEAHFQSYLANSNGEYFAISTDGRHYGYSVCHEGRFNCTESGGTVALRSCKHSSGDVPCKIFAIGETVVWEGALPSGPVPRKVKTEVGSGPITLSSRAQRKFRQYLEEPYPEYFAVTLDGAYAGYSLCYHDSCDGPGLKAIAVSACERSGGGRNCKLYAFKGKVIWKR